MNALPLSRRTILQGGAALALTTLARPVWSAAAPALTVASRQIEVLGRAATVYGITDAAGGIGLNMAAGARLSGALRNATDDALVMHWHGQTRAPALQDRTRPGGGTLAAGAEDQHDFALTPGTHWMHSHGLSEQQLLAAPMICREDDATLPEAVIMLHDFAFRSPAEIATELGASKAHDMAAMGQQTAPADGTAPMDGMAMGDMAMPGMVHANDVAYDAFLANDRSLSDPDVIAAEPGPMRLRIINGGTATGFWITTGALEAQVVAVDGAPCQPLTGRRFPLAQGQRIDLIVTLPASGGAFPILAEVEAATARTGVILATPGAAIARLSDQGALTENLDSRLDAVLRATQGLAPRPADQMLHAALGMGPNYRWTINGAALGEAPDMTAALNSRVEIMFMNPTMMMHPMHLHGHHFQVVDLGQGRFAGPMRDTVIVAPGAMVTVAVDFDKVGSWYLHCHHLYHMAGGMMTAITVA